MKRKMRDSGIAWIGEVPEGWKVCALKYVVSCNDDTLSESTRADFDFDYVDIGSVRYGFGIVETEHFSFGSSPSRARRLVRPGDVIVSTVRTYLKAVAPINNDQANLVVSTGFAVLRPREIQTGFLKYYVMSHGFVSEVEARSVGISYPAINASEVLRINCIVPPLPEQQAIADYLDSECGKIDELRGKIEAQIADLAAHKKSVITEAVTKGDWPKVPLKYLCSMKSGDTLSSLQIRDEGAFRVFGGNGQRGYYDSANTKGPCLLVGRQGALAGNVHYVEGAFWATEHALVTRVIQSMNLRCLYYILIDMNLNQYATNTAAQPGLAVSTIMRIKAPCPPLPEQQEIADYLDRKCAAIDGAVAKCREQLADLAAYKKSLIFECVTGKREVA